MRILDVSTKMLRVIPVALALGATVVVTGCADKSMSAMEQPTEQTKQVSDKQVSEETPGAATNDWYDEISYTPPEEGDDEPGSGGSGGGGGTGGGGGSHEPGDDDDDDNLVALP
jgi:hypothetical protein